MNTDQYVYIKKINSIRFLMFLQFVFSITCVICGTYLICNDHPAIGILLYIITYISRYNYKI